MSYFLKKVWKVYKISRDGLLKEDSAWETFDSEQEAWEFIFNCKGESTLTVLPVTDWGYYNLE